MSEHLKGCAFVELPQEEAKEALSAGVQRFGPVTVAALVGWGGVREFLLPLKSFVTRFVLIELNRWTLLLNDMYGETCFVDALGMSKQTGCIATSAYLHEDSRQWHVLQGGEVVRSVVCYRDGDKWVFEQRGTAGPWEDVNTYRARRLRDRLTPNQVARYIHAVTGLSYPPPWSSVVKDVIGVERSTKDVVEQIRKWDVQVDV